MKSSTEPLPPLRSVKVLDELRERLRYQHHCLGTEQAYVYWVRTFIRFHGLVDPAQLDGSAVDDLHARVEGRRRSRTLRRLDA